MVHETGESSDIDDPEVVTPAEVELFRDECLEERHLPQGFTWEDLVKMVKRELPEVWQLMVLEHQSRSAMSGG